MFVYKIKIPRAKSDPIFETPIFVTNRDAERYWPYEWPQSTRPTFLSLPINACGAIAKKGEKKMATVQWAAHVARGLAIGRL